MATIRPKLAAPDGLPPCWWVACKYTDGRVEFEQAFDTSEDADIEAGLVRERTARWRDVPLAVEVVTEDPAFCAARRSVGHVTRKCHIAARWNWIARNAELLQSAPEHATAGVLVRVGRAADTEGATLRHRLGGKALLPCGHPWPAFELEPWDAGRFERLSAVSQATGIDLTLNAPFRGGTTFGTYLGTFDLRQRFAFGNEFPAGISVFISTYDEGTDAYLEDANTFCATGIVVPLAVDAPLELQAPPASVPELAELTVEACPMPDFPEYGWTPDWRAATESLSFDGPMEPIYDRIEEREPGTSDWINLSGEKIGGFPRFVQGNPVANWSKEFPGFVWHFIASYTGPVMLGDAGVLNVFAGRDPSNGEWLWKCYWECS